MKKKIIIDTDPGIDDAMAIVFAQSSPMVDLLGLTTVFGNVSVKQATENALLLIEKMGVEIPVAKGSSCPLKRKLGPYPDFVHGKNGFGDLDFGKPKAIESDKQAEDFIIEQVFSNPGDVTLVAIGPLTNLANALIKEPGIADAVKEVVLMGGAATVNGNVTPAAEANILSDPDAADIVFTAGWPKTMVGLDVTHQVLMTNSYLKDVHMDGSGNGEFLYKMCRFYLDFHKSMGVEGLYTHDPSAVAYVIKPEIFQTKSGEIRVVTNGIAQGQTIMNHSGNVYQQTPWTGIPKTNVCLGVNSKELLELYRRTMKT